MKHDHTKGKVLCFIPSMGPGGAERVMANLVGEIAGHGYDCTLVSLDPANRSSFYPLSEHIEYSKLGLLTSRSGIIRAITILMRFPKLREVIVREKPQAVVSFLDTMNISVLIASLFLKVPVIVSERVDPAHHRLGLVRNVLRFLTYPAATKIIVQTKRVYSFFPKYLQRNIAVIPNAAPKSTSLATPAQATPGGRFTVLAVCRLEPQKGMERLMKVFAALENFFPDWDLHIYGDGSEHAKLQDIINKLALQSRIILKGVTEDIWQVYASAHIFVHPSHYEGFPNALTEALSFGLPALGYEEVSGVEELIRNGEQGFLVKDDYQLADRLSQMMASAHLRERMGHNAAKWVENWSAEKVHRSWLEVIEHSIGDERG